MSTTVDVKMGPPDPTDIDAQRHTPLRHIRVLNEEENLSSEIGKLKKMSLALTRFR